MRKLISLFLICLALTANARQITANEAAAIASEFLNSSVSAQKATAHVNVRRVKAKDASGSSEANQPYYVFNAEGNNGFVIISGDDRAKKVLGYSDTGNFNMDNMPPQLSAMLDQYAEQISKLTGDTTDSSWSAPARPTSEDEYVLLETANWGQGYPYNAQCPIIDGVQAPTGCVATAMAIVMKYHNWPEGFDWDAMSETGNDMTSDSENKIASIMYEIGRKINTSYGKEDSSTLVGPISYHFFSDYSYSHHCQLISLENIDFSEYLSLIKSEIASNFPVISIGSGDYGTHAFIFDGYYEDYIHVNWGWDGSCNGYFRLFDLSPDYRSFTSNQGLIWGIYPTNEGNEDYSSVAYIDGGYTHNVSCMRAGYGLNIDRKDIHENEPFLATVSTLNILGDCEFGFALLDEHLNIIEVSNIRPTDDLDDFFNVQFEEEIVFNSEISPNYLIGLVARRLGEQQWKIIRGTTEAPSIISAHNYNIKACYMIWDIDPNLKIKIRHGTTEADYLVDELPLNFLKGNMVDVMVYADSPGVVDLECDGAKYGWDINRYNWTYYENKIGSAGSFDVYNDSYTISAHYYPQDKCINGLEIEITEPGTLKDIIPDVFPIIGLTIKGSMNASDFDYLRDREGKLRLLQRLDLKDVSLENNTLPSFALSGHGHLREIHLPQNLECLSEYSLANLSIYEIEFPESVISLSQTTLNGDPLLRKIIVNRDEPIEINDEFFPFSSSHFILSVPTGSKDKYQFSPYAWSNAGRIVEGNKKAVDMTVKYEPYKGKIMRGSGYSAVINFKPEDAADYIITYSENPEIIHTNYFTFPTNSGIVADISTGISGKFQEGKTQISFKSSSGLLKTIEAENIDWLKTLNIDKYEYDVVCGEEFTLEVSSTPDINYFYYEITSDNDEVVEVINQSDMKLIAKSVGEANIHIRVSDNQKSLSKTLKIKVRGILITSLSLNPEVWNSTPGESVQLITNILPETATDKTLEWTSSDTSIATVDENGFATALSVGEAIITATATDGSGVSDSCNVTVNPVLAESLTLDPTTISCEEGTTFKISAKILPENTTNKTLEWTSSNLSVATVDNTGLVSVMKESLCIITASTIDGSNLTAECQLDVLTGIDGIFADEDAVVDIYNTQGTLIKKNCIKEDLQRLVSGIYIIRSSSTILKVLIK